MHAYLPHPYDGILKDERGFDRNKRRGQHRTAVGPTRRRYSSHDGTIITIIITITLAKFTAGGDVPLSVFRRRARVERRLREGQRKPPLLFSRRQGWRVAQSTSQRIIGSLLTSSRLVARCANYFHIHTWVRVRVSLLWFLGALVPGW